jgi:hypothetical protein
VPEQWRISVERLPRYGLPVVWVQLNDWLGVSMVLSTGEPSSCLSDRIAQWLNPGLGRGRRLIPSDAGIVVARLIGLGSLTIRTLDGTLLRVAPFTAALTNRPQVLGIGGVLGNDFLGRYDRLTYELGPPDVLTLDVN